MKKPSEKINNQSKGICKQVKFKQEKKSRASGKTGISKSRK